MQLATWNVNSLKVRLPQVLAWLEANPVDALCLQELKLDHDKFPLEAFTAIGYHAGWAGQKTYNGVAVLSRQPGTDITRNIPGFEDHQQRVLATTLPYGDSTIRVISAYCPNGQEVGSEKYLYKLAWFKAFEAWLITEKQQHPNIAVLGDYNIAPVDADVHNPDKWIGQILVSEPERAAFQSLLALGFTDAFRMVNAEPEQYTWWSNRGRAWDKNVGWRIDYQVVSPGLKSGIVFPDSKEDTCSFSNFSNKFIFVFIFSHGNPKPYTF